MRLRKDIEHGFTFYDPAGENGILANYAPSAPLRARTRVARTLEHLYQASKFSNRPLLARHILLARTPDEAKRRAKRLRHLRDPSFDGAKLEIMAHLVDLRGALDPAFRGALVRTGSAPITELTEAEPFWGKGERGGADWMGRLLIRYRDSLRRSNVKPASTVVPLGLAQRRFRERTRRWLRSISATPRFATSRPQSLRRR